MIMRRKHAVPAQTSPSQFHLFSLSHSRLIVVSLCGCACVCVLSLYRAQFGQRLFSSGSRSIQMHRK